MGNLLEKMKNLRKKFSEMEEVKKSDDGLGSGPSSPQPQTSSRGGRGRARGGRGRGKGRGKLGNDGEEEDWSMQKYDFEAPDIKQAVDSHKPNFVKAEKRVFEKSDGNQSDEQEKESEKKKKDSFKKV